MFSKDPADYTWQEKSVVIVVILVVLFTGLWGANKVLDENECQQVGTTGIWFGTDGLTYLEGCDKGKAYDGKVGDLSSNPQFSGQINSLTISSSGPVVLRQPEQAIITLVNDGDSQVMNSSYLVLPEDGTFELLISPTATELVLEFYGHGKSTFTRKVEEGPDQLTSGQQVYDLMLTVTDDDNPPGYENGYNGRWYSPSNPQFMRGAEFFRDTLASFGLDAEIQYYYPDGSNNPTIINVVAIKWGEDTSSFIGVGGHMDVVAPVAPGIYGTVQGAYDDTSGTVMTIELAEALAELKTQHSYFFGLWAAEEEGIHGSSHFVNNFQDNYPGASIKAYVNLDMVGIGWPGIGDDGKDYPTHGYIGGQRTGQQAEPVRGFEGIVNHTAFSFLGFPRLPAFELGHSHFGRSDHVPFQREGIPCTFYIGPHDGQYTEYHQLEDTLSNMESWMGSQEGLIESFDIYIWMALTNLLLLDVEEAG